MYEICNPCYIKYDFIGRYENLHTDVKTVVSKLTNVIKPQKNVTFPRLNFSKSKQRFSVYFGNLSHNLVRNLIHMYKPDYELFGYDYRWACEDC